MGNRLECVMASLLACALATGCSSPEKRDKGYVVREWSKTLRELSVNPVFPPREDLVVGDVYLTRTDPYNPKLRPGKGYVPIELWLTYIDLREKLSDFYRSRCTFPDTPPGTPAGEPPSTEPFLTMASPTSGDDVFLNNGSTERLRQVAFPDFAAMSVQGADLQAFIPVEALNIAFGASWQRANEMNVKIPAAESYGLPFGMVIRALIEKHLEARPGGFVAKQTGSLALPEGLIGELWQSNYDWFEKSGQYTPEQLKSLHDDENLYLELITEVYYARSIDISISSKSSFGFRVFAGKDDADGDTGKVDESKTEQETKSTKAADNGTETEETETRTAETKASFALTGNAYERASQLNERLRQVDALTVPGGSFQFLSVSDRSVSMRRTFLHPVAVGYRGFVLTLDKSTGTLAVGTAVNEATAKFHEEPFQAFGK